MNPLDTPPVSATETVTRLLNEDDTFLAHLERRAVGTPWLHERKRSAWNRFRELPMPTRKDEKWRFSRLDRKLLDGLRLSDELGEQAGSELATCSHLIEETAGRLVAANDFVVDFQGVSDELASKGVFFGPLELALEQIPEVVERYFLSEGTQLGSEKFFALHGAYVKCATVLYVPRGVTIEQPLLAHYWHAQDGAAIFPHTLAVLEENAEATLIDAFFSHNLEASGSAFASADLHAGANARLKRIVVQDFNEQVQSFQMDAAVAQRDAQIKNISVNLGAKQARYETQCRIEGAGADIRNFSLTVADSDQEFDQRTLQIHNAPNAVSDLLYKNALLDRARSIFSGLIQVAENAQQTDAYQTNRNLLLDSTAEANSLPGLEINANDVKCSHGATTSQLDQEELFYFMARGIPAREAKRLL
ncbi:MAG: Fe-S cluster assembly protein SufD, partial [Verrucomicrobiota bacterium]